MCFSGLFFAVVNILNYNQANGANGCTAIRDSVVIKVVVAF